MSDESSARDETFASRETTFLGLNDRLLTPALAIGIMMLMHSFLLSVGTFFALLVIELVMKFAMRSTWGDFYKIMRAFLIENPRKPVKN